MTPMQTTTWRAFPFIIALLLANLRCSFVPHIPLRQEPAIPRIAAMSSSPYPLLKMQLDSLLADSLFPPSNLAVKIVSLTGNDTLYELNPRMLFHPASNQKLFTSATALRTLGATFSFPTVVRMDTVLRRLIVAGHGDPILSSSDIDSMARAVAPLMCHLSGWILVGDVSYFDDVYWGDSWGWDGEPDPDAMFISPLSVNSNAIVVWVRPGNRAGDSLLVWTDPPTGFVSIENTSVTRSDTVLTPLKVSRKWRDRSNTITVSGEMLAGKSAVRRKLSIWQPERYVLSLLAEKLKIQGVVIDSITIDSIGTVAPEVFCFRHQLDTIITYLNKESDNLSAENVLKTLGAERRGRPGTAQGGLSVLKAFVSSIGIDTTRISLKDGSGVSRQNLVSADAVIRLLVFMFNDSAHFDGFYRSLPIAGVDGTIKNRMRYSEAEGNLHAKTGTLNGVSALSGYVRTADGEPLAFSLIMQHFPNGLNSYKNVQDRIGIFLSRLRRADF